MDVAPARTVQLQREPETPVSPAPHPAHADEEWIAEREFRTADGHSVIMSIGRPTRTATGEWSCAVRVTGIESPEITEAFGEDSVQALLMALSMARARVELLRRLHGLTWLGADDLGISLV